MTIDATVSNFKPAYTLGAMASGDYAKHPHGRLVREHYNASRRGARIFCHVTQAAGIIFLLLRIDIVAVAAAPQRAQPPRSSNCEC